MAGPGEGSFSPDIDAPHLPPGTIIVQQQQTRDISAVGPWPLLIGLVAPMAAWLAFTLGHVAIDRPEPDMATAQVWYSLTAVAGAAALGLTVWRRERLWMLAVALPAAALFGWATASLSEELYGPFLVFFLAIAVAYIGVPTAIFMGILMIVMGVREGAAGVAYAVQTTGVTVAGGFAGAAIYHLSTLERQAQLARDSYDIPGFELVFLVVAIVGIACWRKVRS